MKALAFWLVAGTITTVSAIFGLPLSLTVLLACPFAALAGWYLIKPPERHACGWCGRQFSGAYEWCCPNCEGEPQ